MRLFVPDFEGRRAADAKDAKEHCTSDKDKAFEAQRKEVRIPVIAIRVPDRRRSVFLRNPIRDRSAATLAG
jgi:hypothetical protein